MKSLMQYIVQQVIGIQDIIVSQVRMKRGSNFEVDDWIPIIKFKEKRKVLKNQSKEIINLYKEAARAHYETIKSLTSTIKAKDEPWTENFQAPATLSILFELDSNFKKSIEKFVKELKKSDRIIERMIF